MTKLETILSHFKDMAEHLRNTGDDTPEYREIYSLLDGIENGDITADSLIKEYQKADGVFLADWNISDIKDYALENESLELTDEQAWEVADRIVKYHDANEGVNWGVIEIALDYFLEKGGWKN